ncbi:hypothetical protein D3OALGA1CA_1886 [Olavius algarvensis associated proteobacterium Delta 3]|nr:hypothetical protein D3OALGA1CA_1886 [Olavius algarvensis associated proteobacterium Delta 3]
MLREYLSNRLGNRSTRVNPVQRIDNHAWNRCRQEPVNGDKRIGGLLGG